MRIGIMTFPNMTSYGCTLQMYALYRAVEQAGAEAEIINYRNEYMKARRHTRAGRFGSSPKAAMRVAAAKLLHLRQINAFRNFERKLSQYPAKVTADKRVLRESAKRYDGVICGSDQVWNPLITDMDLSFFLDFCGPDTKRIAYAPSFGISEFPGEFTEKIRPELEKFRHLSVREEAGVRYVESLVNRKADTVLDPTFLIPKQDWIALEKVHPLAKGKYILCFPVRKSAALIRFGRELAEKKNATLIVVEGNFLTRLRNKDARIQYALDISPEEWLSLLHHADCVVTNSFHGAAFSIHYQKDFFLECSSAKANSRLEQLAALCGLEDRIIRDGFDGADLPIDYENVEARIAPARQASLDYLKQSIWT